MTSSLSFLFRELDHIVNRPKMMNRFQNIVYRNTLSGINRIRLENQPYLIFGKFAAFDMARMTGHPHLEFVIETSG